MKKLSPSHARAFEKIKNTPGLNALDLNERMPTLMSLLNRGLVRYDRHVQHVYWPRFLRYFFACE